MSRPLPASLLLGALLLAILGPVLLAGSARGFGERTYESNPVVGPDSLQVYDSQSVAQSFVATDTYHLLRVTLRLRNTGSTSDSLGVSIESDGGAEPSGTAVASSVVTSGGTIGQVDVSFPSEPILSDGARYWIVATNAGLISDAYHWYRSADGQDSYADGWAMTDVGLGWTNTTFATDLHFSTFGREVDANMSVRIEATPRDPMPDDVVTFTVFYNNTGTLPADRVWVNSTLPPGLSHVSDTASASSTPFPAFTFAAVANGAHSFEIAARVDIGVPPGTDLVHAVDLEYTNGTGVPRPGSADAATVSVGIVAKQLYLSRDAAAPYVLSTARPTGGPAQQSNLTLRRGDPPTDFDLTPALANDFRALDLGTLLFIDSDQDRTDTLNFAVALADWNGVTLTVVASRVGRLTTNNFDDFEPFGMSFPAFDHTFAAGHVVRLRIANLGNSSEDAVLAVNSTFADSRAELTTSTYVSVDAIELRDLAGPATAWTALDGLVVRANVSDPLGSGDIPRTRVRVTDPTGTVVLDDVPMTRIATDPAPRSAWKVFEATVSPPLLDGPYDVVVTGVETNGVVDLARATAVVESPRFEVTKLATAGSVRSGDRFFYHVWLNNTGDAAAATVWINDTLPSEVLFVSDSDPANRTGPANWTRSAVGAGSRLLAIEVEVRSGIPPVPFFGNTVAVDVEDSKGHRWPRMTAAVDVVLDGPVIALTKVADRASVHAAELVTFSIDVSNTGEIAPLLWVNDTLPSGLGFVSTTAGSLGGIVSFEGGLIHVRFENLTGGTANSFDIVAQTAVGLTPGAALTNVATAAYTNANGVSMPPRTANASVTVIAPRIVGATVGLLASSAVPGTPVESNVNFTNAGNEPAGSLWLNLTMDSNLVFLNASWPGTVTGNVVRFVLQDADVGAHTLRMNVTIAPTATDGLLLGISGSIDYADANGNAFARVTAVPASVRVSGPRILVSATPATSTVEAAEPLDVTIVHTNAGSGAAGHVWLNLSLPAGFVYGSDTSSAERTVTASSLSWHRGLWSAGSSETFALRLVARANVVDQNAAALTFRSDYADTNGNGRTATPAIVNVTFVAPVISIQLAVRPGETNPGSVVTYDIQVRNTGSTSAGMLWLTDALDPSVSFLLQTSGVGEDRTGNVVNLTFADFIPGRIESFTLQVQIRAGVGDGTPVPHVLEANYTNSVGTSIGFARSTPVTIVVVADTLFLVWLTAGGLALAAVPVAIAIRRRNVSVEEVFLVYRDGVLMYHTSRTLLEEKDEDVLSGMLTAVQEFVRDAFRYGEHRELHQLDFGEYRILIERGKLVYLAVVYSGHDSPGIRKRVRSVLDRIELAYGDVLEHWDGDMERVIGARDVIRDHLLKPNGRRGKASKAA